MKPLWATVSLLLEPHRPWANISLCHTHHSNMVISPHAHSSSREPSMCFCTDHLYFSVSLCSALSFHAVWNMFASFYEKIKVAFLWHLSPVIVSSGSSLPDYLLCFPLILIRGFHSEHQKSSWQSCILGRAPQGKCNQAAVKLSTVSSITQTLEPVQQLFCVPMNMLQQPIWSNRCIYYWDSFLTVSRI